MVIATDPSGNTITTMSDAAGNLISTTTTVNGVTTTTDAAGNVITDGTSGTTAADTYTDPFGDLTTFADWNALATFLCDTDENKAKFCDSTGN